MAEELKRNKIYLVTGSEDSFFDYSFLTVSNNKMTIKKTIKGEILDVVIPFQSKNKLLNQKHTSILRVYSLY